MLRYSFLMRDLTQTAVIAAIALVLLVTAAAFLSRQPPALPTATPTPSVAPAVTLQEYSLNGTKLAFSQQTNSSNAGFREELNVSNKGEKNAEFGLVDALPESISKNAFFENLFYPNSTQPKSIDVLNLNPMVRFAVLTLKPNEFFSTRLTSPSPSGESPVHVLAPPELSDSDKQKIVELSKKLADLHLNAGEALAVQEKLNNALSSVTAQGAALDDFFNASNAFLSRVRDAKERQAKDPAFKWSIQDEQVKIEPSGVKTESVPESITRQLPNEISFTLSEADPEGTLSKPSAPEGTKIISVETPADAGDWIGKVSEELTAFAKVQTSKKVAGGKFKYELALTVDLSSVKPSDGLFPFDSLQGDLKMGFTSLPLRFFNTRVKVTINHINMVKLFAIFAKKQKDDFGEMPLTPETVAELVPEYEKEKAAGTLPQTKFETIGTMKNENWICPFKAAVRITSPFGYRKHPVSGKVNMMHWGMDLSSGSCGAQVTAALGGTVTTAAFVGACGNEVVINHGKNAAGNTLETVYCHLNKIEIKVKEGAVVQAGDQIGTVGTTGSSTGCHLHFQLEKNGVPQDPKDVIKEACGITAAAP